MDKIANLRKQIDLIDHQMMNLLDSRFLLTAKIGQLKKKTNANVFDKSREANILDKASKYSHYPQIIEIYETIMEQSKKLQRKK